MNWLEVKVITVREAIEFVANTFHELQAGGVVIEDPQLIALYAHRGQWDDHEFSPELLQRKEVIVKGYLPMDEFLVKKLEELKQELAVLKIRLGNIPTELEVVEVQEEDWANSWKAYFKPLKIGQKTVIKPSWEEYTVQEGELVIELDPGMAFGTGDHATTSLCINLLEKYIKENMKVIDVGCGSGILSILAAKLGSHRVEALDYDNVAVKVARENVAINNLSEKVLVKQSDLLKEASLEADVIVANIVADIIIELTPQVQKYLKEKGFFICSGIIDKRKEDVLNILAKYNLTVKEIVEKDGWVAIVAQG